MIAKIMSLQEGVKTYNECVAIKIKSSKYNLLVMEGHAPWSGEIKGSIELTLKNIAKEEIKFNSKDIMERFVRGDKSRNAEGTGLGLAIAKSFIEVQGGTFNIVLDGDLFKVIIKFNK